MKKTLVIIFIGLMMLCTACADETSTTTNTSSENETKETEKIMESTTENITDIEMSDEEYLINLGKQLKPGMSTKEVIEKIGEPDERFGSGFTFLSYFKGDWTLMVCIGTTVYEVSVGNKETGMTTVIFPIHNETETDVPTESITEIEVSDEEYLINLGKQLKLSMTEEEVIEKIGEPYDRLEGSGMLYVLMYRRGECGLSVFIRPPYDKVSEVRVHNDETGTNIYPLYGDETETTE